MVNAFFSTRVNLWLKDRKKNNRFQYYNNEFVLKQTNSIHEIFQNASVISNDPYTTQTVHAFQKRLSITLSEA